MSTMQALRRMAEKLDGVEIGVACAGTKLEKVTAKVGGKAFVFLGVDDAMMKLAASADEARKLGFAPGKSGWTKVAPLADAPLPVVKRWIEESYALFACPVTPTSAGSSGRAPRGTTTRSSRPRSSKASTRSPGSKKRSR